MPLPTQNFRSPTALARFFLTMLVGLGLDLWTKSVAFERLASGPPYQFFDTMLGHQRWVVDARPPYGFIPKLISFQVTVNEGAVFGLGQGQRWVFLVISIAAILFLTYLFAASDRQRFYQFVLGLLLAGVLGNMYDRMRYGYVRDMIYGLPGWKLPGSQRDVFPWIFNVADVLLCVGVGLIFLYSLAQMRAAKKKPSAEPTA